MSGFRTCWYRFIIYFGFLSLLLFYSCEKGSRGDQQGKPVSGQDENGSSERSREILRHRTLGLAYLEENKLSEAESEFRELTELSPDEALGYANLGIVYMRMGDYEKAEKQLKKAIALNPDDPDIRLNLPGYMN